MNCSNTARDEKLVYYYCIGEAAARKGHVCSLTIAESRVVHKKWERKIIDDNHLGLYRVEFRKVKIGAIRFCDDLGIQKNKKMTLVMSSVTCILKKFVIHAL